MSPRDLRILGGNTNHALHPVDRVLITCSYDHTTARYAKVERQQKVGFRLEQHVAADNSTISNPMLDVNRNIRRLHEDETILATIVCECEPSRIQRFFTHANTGTREQWQRALLYPSLCNRNRDHQPEEFLRPRTSVSASRLSTKPTAGSARPKLPVRPS